MRLFFGGRSRVVKATTATGMASSANPSKAGRKVTYAATVTGISPTGYGGLH